MNHNFDKLDNKILIVKVEKYLRDNGKLWNNLGSRIIVTFIYFKIN